MSKKMILFNNLRELRKERNISQEQMASDLGLSRMTISAIETGRFVPNAGVAAQICAYLEQPFETVFYLEAVEIPEKRRNKIGD